MLLGEMSGEGQIYRNPSRSHLQFGNSAGTRGTFLGRVLSPISESAG